MGRSLTEMDKQLANLLTQNVNQTMISFRHPKVE